MMKMTAKKLALASSIAFLFSANVMAAELNSELDKESYSVGASVGKYLSNQIYSQTEMGADINMDVMIEGFVDALKDTSELTDEQVVDYLNKRGELLNKKREAQLAAIIEKNLTASKEFLTNNAKKDGVVVMESGLQYEVLTKGNGPIPKAEDVVTVNYVGKLIDGTEFESTYTQNRPARFALMSVIEGWQEGLKLMPQGSTYRLTIPAELAYGKDGAGAIPPQSAIVFDIELVNVEQPGNQELLKTIDAMQLTGHK
ncbi:FKBP-type peptidyl-prolyl cis-trans isomerase [Shewanella marina]|uniref:FKBP-type peptidyl-prolyl cis-trans isomerase n=1 Tax=Shewanella marina TaxID=487319 RepID=UPI000B31E4C5|nr:FKBP-type peptidyl-prolyl cis-trans isomerase [Shewanella marina]